MVEKCAQRVDGNIYSQSQSPNQTKNTGTY